MESGVEMEWSMELLMEFGGGAARCPSFPFPWLRQVDTLFFAWLPQASVAPS